MLHVEIDAVLASQSDEALVLVVGVLSTWLGHGDSCLSAPLWGLGRAGRARIAPRPAPALVGPFLAR